MDGFAIAQIVFCVDAVNEDDAGLGIIIGGLHDLVPQSTRGDCFVGVACKDQRPACIIFNSRHEGIRHQNGQVEIAQAQGITFCGNEGFNIGMVAAQGSHHGPASRTCRHDGAAHGVPHIHETQGAGCIGTNTSNGGSLGAKGREVMANTAALLQGEGCFLQALKNTCHGIIDLTHDKAVEHGDTAPRSSAGHNSARRQELEPGQYFIEGRGPFFLVTRFFSLGDSASHAPPRVLQSLVMDGSARFLEPIFHVPNLLRDGIENL